MQIKRTVTLKELLNNLDLLSYQKPKLRNVLEQLISWHLYFKEFYNEEIQYFEKLELNTMFEIDYFVFCI